MKRVFFALIAMIAMVACGKSDSASIFNTEWQLQKMNGETIDRAILAEDNSLTLSFTKDDDGTIRLNAVGDPNRIFSSIKLNESDRTMEVGQLPLSRMNPKNQKLEMDYLDALHAAKSYSIKGDILTIMNGDEKPILVFKKVGTIEKK